MVKIGDVFWEAEIRGVGEAQEQGSELSDTFDDVAGSFLGTAAAEEVATEATEENTEAKRVNERWTERLSADSGILGSALTFLSSRFGIATTASTAYAGALGLVTTATGAATTATKGLIAVLAGPTGVASGLFTAVVGVGLFGSELLGLTDITPIVEAETSSMSSAFADMAFLIGGPLVGFLGAAFHALTGNFEGAKNAFINTSVEWAKAAARFAARVKLGFAAFGQAVVTGFRATIETIDFAWRAGFNALAAFLNRWVERIRDGIVSGLNNAVRESIDPLNRLIAKVNEIPRVDIEPISEDFRFAETTGRQTAEINTLGNEDLASRLARVRRQGRQNLATVEEETRRQIERFAPDTIGAGRRTQTGVGGPARTPAEARRQNRRRRRAMERRRERVEEGDGGPDEQRIIVNIDAGGIDFTNLSRAEQRRLAKLIGDELGEDTQDRVGAR